VRRGDDDVVRSVSFSSLTAPAMVPPVSIMSSLMMHVLP